MALLQINLVLVESPLGQALPSLWLQLGGQHSPADPTALPHHPATTLAASSVCCSNFLLPGQKNAKRLSCSSRRVGRQGTTPAQVSVGRGTPKMQGRRHRSPPCPGDSGRWAWPLCLHHLVRVRLRPSSSSAKLHTAAGSETAVHFPDPRWGTFGPGPCVASPDRALDGVLSENQQKTDLRVMDTDYKHYAIVYTLRDRGQEPSTTLQLYSGCRSGEGHPGAGLGQAMGNGGWQGWCSSSPPHQHPSMLALSHTPGIHLGVNETLHHQFTLVSPRSLPAVFWSGCRPPELSAALLGSGWVGTRPWGGVHSSEVGVVPPCCQPGMAMGYPAAVLCLLGPLTHLGCLAAAREPDVSPQFLQKFKALFHTVGLTEDMLAILPQSGECQGWGWPACSLCTGRLHRCLGLSMWEHTHASLSV